MKASTRVHQEVARYRLEAPIGRGGMGTVYRALDLDLGRVVALKVIDVRSAPTPELRSALRLEAELLPRLSHPNIVPVYETGEADGLLYISMPLISGDNLKVHLLAEGPFGPERTHRIASQVAAALDLAHESGFVHRDVKPQNILMFRHGGAEHVLLSDFGLVVDLSSDSRFSASGHFMGSLNYAAPEQIKGGRVDGRTDVYALGCVLYECLTGTVPFPRSTGFEVLWAHVNDEPTRPTDIQTSLGTAVDEVIARAMAKDPDDRYLTAGETSQALKRALGLEDAKARSATGRPSSDPWTRPLAPNPALDLVSKSLAPVGESRRLSLARVIGVAAVLLIMLVMLSPWGKRAIDDPLGIASANLVTDDIGEPDDETDPSVDSDGSDEARAPRGRRGAGTELILGPRAAEIGSGGHATDLPSAKRQPGPARAPIQGSNGRIAFDDGRDVWAISPKGNNLRNLTSSIGDATNPVWSPDGTRLAVSGEAGRMIVMDADGSGVAKIADGSDPAWSPDGMTIAYVSWWLEGGIRVVDADGSNPKTLTTDEGPFSDRSPDWSPDGSRLVFVRGSESGGGDLHLINRDGSGLVRIAFGVLPNYAPAWSPDGERIAFQREDASGRNAIFVMSASGGNLVRISPEDLDATSPDWSPDGRLITFSADGDVYIMGLHGDDARRVERDDLAANNPAWQPRCTVRGSNGADVLTGSQGPDLVCGLGGNDSIFGLDGSDVLFGGPGDDRVRGGPGNDILSGGGGENRLDGGSGIDSCSQGQLRRCE